MSSDAWQSPPLASEQVDLDAESRRLEAFSRYVPKFYFANGPLSAVSGDSLPLLAESPIWDVSADDFFAVLEKWCYQPEIVNPPVERAEVSRDEAATSYKTVTRRLISKRRDKDNDLVERVLFSRSTNVAYVEFEPLVGTAEEIPFYYPKVRKIVYKFETLTTSDPQCSMLSICIEPYGDISALEFSKKQQEIWRSLFKKLYKWIVNEHVGYRKRTQMNVLVPKDLYTETYQRLKAKHAHWLVSVWTEKTDPQKFVYEDIAIASWLLCLWHPRKPSFVDLGCGNGLLVYILSQEGCRGYGIDQCSRKIWATFQKHTADLRAQTILPYETRFDVDWIIGNHSDELSPWVPLIAARSGFKSFVCIPCCPHDLSGRLMHLAAQPGESKYMLYTNYIKCLSEECGYNPEREFLRIPSPKNVAVVGRSTTFDQVAEKDRTRAALCHVEQICADASRSFAPRIPDSVKNELRMQRQQEREPV